MSSLKVSDVDNCRSRIMKFFEKSMEVIEILIPYEDGKMISQIYELGHIESKKETEKGLFFRLRTLPEFAKQLNLARYKI